MTHVVANEASVPGTVELAASGDKAAFARLIDAHHAQMMRVAYVVTGDAEAAADAVQSAWEVAWRRLGGLRDRRQVRPWLMTVAANEARQIRRRQRRTSVVDISTLLEQPRASETADTIALVDLKRSLARLTADDRALLTLRFVGRMDSNEIGQYFGMSPSGVRSRLPRLLDRLRGDLQVRTGRQR